MLGKSQTQEDRITFPFTWTLDLNIRVWRKDLRGGWDYWREGGRREGTE